jgi:hypothetical protein
MRPILLVLAVLLVSSLALSGCTEKPDNACEQGDAPLLTGGDGTKEGGPNAGEAGGDSVDVDAEIDSLVEGSPQLQQLIDDNPNLQGLIDQHGSDEINQTLQDNPDLQVILNNNPDLQSLLGLGG